MSAGQLTINALAREIPSEKWYSLVQKLKQRQSDSTSSFDQQSFTNEIIDTLLPLIVLSPTVQHLPLAYFIKALRSPSSTPLSVATRTLFYVQPFLDEHDSPESNFLDNLETICQAICVEWSDGTPSSIPDSPESPPTTLLPSVTNLVFLLLNNHSAEDSARLRPYTHSTLVRILKAIDAAEAKLGEEDQTKLETLMQKLLLPDKNHGEDSTIPEDGKPINDDVDMDAVPSPENPTAQNPQAPLDPIWIAQLMSDNTLTPAQLHPPDLESLPEHAPGYIMIHVLRCVQSSWSSEAEWTDTESGNYPPAFKNLIHMGPFLAISSEVFFHQLILASLDILLDKMNRMGEEDALRARMAVGGENFADGPAVPGDTGLEVDINEHMQNEEVGQDQGGSKPTGLSVSNNGFQELIWMMHDLPRALAYWKGASATDSQQDGRWRGFAFTTPDVIATSLEVILTRRKADFHAFDANWLELLNGLGAFDSAPISLSSMLLGAFVQYRLLDPSDIQDLVLREGFASVDSDTCHQDSQAWLTAACERADGGFAKSLLQLYAQPHLWSFVSTGIRSALKNPYRIMDGLLCLLTEDASLLHLISRYVTPVDLLDAILPTLSSSASATESADDAQTWMTHFGQIVLFAKRLCSEFDLPAPSVLAATRETYLLESLDPDEQVCLNDWIQALFGDGSIAEDLLKMTNPVILLRMAPTIVSQAIYATMADVLTLEKLQNGISYFSQPLLNWTLGPVISWLCGEIDLRGSFSGVLLEVLQGFVNAPEVPRSIRNMAQHDLQRTTTRVKRENCSKGLITGDTDMALRQSRCASKHLKSKYLPSVAGGGALGQMAKLAWRTYLQSDEASARMCDAVLLLGKRGELRWGDMTGVGRSLDGDALGQEELLRSWRSIVALRLADGSFPVHADRPFVDVTGDEQAWAKHRVLLDLARFSA